MTDSEEAMLKRIDLATELRLKPEPEDKEAFFTYLDRLLEDGRRERRDHNRDRRALDD